MARFKRQMQLTGGSELKETLNKLPAKALQESVLDKANRAGAKHVAQAMREEAPQGEGHPRFGNLVDNIRVNKAPKRMRLRRMVGHMVIHNSDAFWGLFLEFGTVKMSPQPWMRPGLDRSWREAVQEVGQRMQKVLEREAEKLSGSFGQLGKARRRRLGRG